MIDRAPAMLIAGPVLWRGPQKCFGGVEPTVRHCAVIRHDMPRSKSKGEIRCYQREIILHL